MAKKLNNENPIDKLFREGMEQRQFVYEEKFWEDAENVLSDFNKAADKKRYVWWIGGGIATVVTLVCIFFVAQNTREEDALAQHTAPQQAAQQTEQVLPAPAVTSTQQNETADHTLSNNQQEQLNIQNQSTYHTQTFTQDQSADANDAAINQNQSDEDDAVNNAVASENTHNANSSDAQSPDYRIDDQALNNTDNQTEIPVKPIEEDQIADEQGPWQEEPGVSIALTQGALPPKNLNTTRVQWFAGIYAGTQRSYAHFGSGPQIWIDHVEKAQEPAFSPTISLEAGLRIKPFPVDVNLSVNFMQMGEDGFFAVQRSYLDTSFTVDSYTEIIIDTIYIGGEPLIDTTYIIVNDTTWNYYANDSTEIRQVSNRLYYAEIPMMFGYTYQHNKWSFRLSTGPSVGILHKRAGYYPNDMLNDFDALEELDYFNDVVWYWRIDPAIGYALSPSVSLQCRGTFRAQISDTYNADDRSLRYITHGLQVGLRYTFMGN